MTLTAPFDPRALTEFAQTLPATCALRATSAAGVDLGVLDFESLVLTFDEGWAPMAQAEITLNDRPPAGFDPRQGARVAIELGYQYPGGTLDQHPAADLQVTAWSGTTTSRSATAHGDELRLMRYAPLGYTRTYAVGTSLVEIIAEQITAALGRTPLISANVLDALREPLTISPATQLWDLLKSLADQAGLWVYADGLGRWHVAPRPVSTGASVVQMLTGPGGSVTDTEEGISLDGWGNAVVLEFGDGQTSFAHRPDGPMGTDAVGVHAVRERTTAPWPGTIAATIAAESILARVITRGDAESLTGLAAWWLRPGDTLTTPTGARVIASRVRFLFPSALMTVTTRKA